ncbi:eCIS core domain-containing protein [Massilia timonae]|nr:DUF4157 domain-containing protein [Massilia timonae]
MQAPLQAGNDSDAAQTDTTRAVAQKRGLADNRSDAVAQAELAEMMNDSPRVLQQRVLSNAIHHSPRMVAQRHEINALFDGTVKPQGDCAMPADASPAQREEKTNDTGLPDRLKSGIESLSGMSMDHVKVHYNSDKPAQLQAHAYAQGNEIHLGAGQERHLPHEAWHVVQQAQGRVRPTLQMKGGAVNDDPSLEKEADMMGEKAAQFEGDHVSGNLVAEKRVAGAVTQRVTGFAQRELAGTSNESPKRKAQQSLIRVVSSSPQAIAQARRKDSMIEAGKLRPGSANNFYELFTGPNRGAIPGGGPAPIQGKFVYTNEERFIDDLDNTEYGIVAYHDDEDVTVRPVGQRSDQHNVRLRRDVASGAWEKVSMEIEESESNISDDESDKHPFNLGLQISTQKSEHDGPKLSSRLTSQVTVVPVATGKLKSVGEVQDMVYNAAQLWIEGVQLGNQDRPETRYGDRQERHTVAWVLQRAAQMAMHNRPVAEVLAHYIASMKALAAEEQSRNCKLLIDSVLVSADSLTGATLPIDTWQQLISRIMVLYIQAYQQAGSSTFKHGKATGHGEGSHMAVLRNAEEAIIAKTDVDANKVIAAAAGLLDGGFYKALGPEGYASAVSHWKEALHLAFPELMAAHGAAIQNNVYSSALSPGVRKQFKLASDANLGGLVALLERAPNISPLKQRSPLVQGGNGAVLVPVQQSLESDFTANVRVVPAADGQLVTVTTQVQGQAAVDVEQLAYGSGEVTLNSIQVSDQDRPNTRFATQMSHTVAWTLVRAEMASFTGHPAAEALIVMASRFARFVTDLEREDARELARASEVQAMSLLDQRLPVHRWQAAMSDVFRRFAIVYQLTKSATFADDTTHGRALGHAEGHAMNRLATNEKAILDAGKTADGPEVVVGAAFTLFDGHVNSTLPPLALVAAVLHWHESLQRVFPNVMRLIADNVKARLQSTSLSKPINDIRNLADLVAKFKPLVDAGKKDTDHARDTTGLAQVIADPLVGPDGGILPAAQARFIAAYRNDVRLSTAYLAEGEAHHVATSLGLRIDIHRGQVPLGWHETTNPGDGNCLIHALIAAREAAAGRAPANATGAEIAAARATIAAAMTDDDVLAQCAAAVFGVFLGAPEAGLGPQMRALLSAPSVVQARISFAPAPTTSPMSGGLSSSIRSGGGGVEAQGGITIGAGVSVNNIRLRHDGGAHYTMIWTNDYLPSFTNVSGS